MKRSTDEEVLRRTHLCVRMLNEGWTAMQISQFVSGVDAKQKSGQEITEQEAEFDWKVTERQVYEYCEKAFNVIDELAMQSTETYYKQAIERLNTIYRRALKANNFNAALKAQEMIMQLTRAGNFNKPPEEGAEEGNPGSEFILPNGDKIKI